MSAQPCFFVLLLISASLATPAFAAERGRAKAAKNQQDQELNGNIKKPESGVQQKFELGVAGRLGGSVGHALLVPYAFALPGPGVDLKYRLSFAERWHVEARVNGELGVDETGVLGGGYGGWAAIGFTWFDHGWVSAMSDFHLGLSSVSLIPVPAGGFRHELAFYPIHWDWMVWDITLQGTTDLLVIVPKLSVGVSTGVGFRLWDLELGVEAEAKGGVLIAIIANNASGTVGARVFGAWHF